MNYEKYAHKPFIYDPEWTYTQPDYPDGRPMAYTKPHGFWISVPGEDDWPSWCRNESWNGGGLDHLYSISLREDANVIRLTTVTEMYAFQQEYGEEVKWGPGSQFTDIRIRWDRVAEDFDGVIIAPYHWELRMEFDWYYTWDCASGCIWNLAAIESVVEVPLMVEEDA